MDKHPLRKIKATIEDIERLVPLITHSGSLCGFLGKCEKKVMVGQTIHACKNNHLEGLGCFSFKAIKMAADNLRSYSELVNDGLFIEEKHGEKTVIYPTKALIAKLEGFFA